jgi:hypothetical protein
MRMIQAQSKLKAILDAVMSDYRASVPDVGAILAAMRDAGVVETERGIENDHIAFRTVGGSHCGIASLEKVFLHHGYSRRDAYRFAEKKLDAFWYSPPDESLPRVFISELRVEDLSPEARRCVTSYTSEAEASHLTAIDMDSTEAVIALFRRSLWRAPSLADYRLLAGESEYAAWVLCHRYRLNHFTVSIHNLKEGYNTIEQFNAFLEGRGFVLNDSGGKCKTSPDGLLIQSSTVANLVHAVFAGGESCKIAGSYVEFAERKVLPEFRGRPREAITRRERREGFEASNADKIFESTYAEQTLRGGQAKLSG